MHCKRWSQPAWLAGFAHTKEPHWIKWRIFQILCFGDRVRLGHEWDFVCDLWVPATTWQSQETQRRLPRRDAWQTLVPRSVYHLHIHDVCQRLWGIYANRTPACLTWAGRDRNGMEWRGMAPGATQRVQRPEEQSWRWPGGQGWCPRSHSRLLLGLQVWKVLPCRVLHLLGTCDPFYASFSPSGMWMSVLCQLLLL